MELNSYNLKQTIWDTLKQVKAKKLTHHSASSVAANARIILNAVRLEIEVQKLLGQKPNIATTKFLLMDKTGVVK